MSKVIKIVHFIPPINTRYTREKNENCDTCSSTSENQWQFRGYCFGTFTVYFIYCKHTLITTVCLFSESVR